MTSNPKFIQTKTNKKGYGNLLTIITTNLNSTLKKSMKRQKRESFYWQ